MAIQANLSKRKHLEAPAVHSSALGTRHDGGAGLFAAPTRIDASGAALSRCHPSNAQGGGSDAHELLVLFTHCTSPARSNGRAQERGV